MAKVITNYSITYCGKCLDGFIQTTGKNGEDMIVPCSCKIEHDRKFLLKKIELDASIQVYSCGDWNYDNKNVWLKELVEKNDAVPKGAFEILYSRCMATTTSKFVEFSTFLTRVSMHEPTEGESINFYIDNSREIKDKFAYFMNFIALLYVKRLVPVRLLTFTEIKSVILDKDKISFEEFVGDALVIIIQDMFSPEMIEQLSNTYVYDRLFKFMKFLYKSPATVIIGGSQKMDSIRDLKGFEGKTDIGNRVSSLFNMVLNNSRTISMVI